MKRVASNLTARKRLAEMQPNGLLHQEIAYFFRQLEEMEPRRCMFDLSGRCDAPPVNGHFIQEGLLNSCGIEIKRKGSSLSTISPRKTCQR